MEPNIDRSMWAIIALVVVTAVGFLVKDAVTTAMINTFIKFSDILGVEFDPNDLPEWIASDFLQGNPEYANGGNQQLASTEKGSMTKELIQNHPELFTKSAIASLNVAIDQKLLDTIDIIISDPNSYRMSLEDATHNLNQIRTAAADTVNYPGIDLTNELAEMERMIQDPENISKGAFVNAILNAEKKFADKNLNAPLLAKNTNIYASNAPIFKISSTLPQGGIQNTINNFAFKTEASQTKFLEAQSAFANYYKDEFSTLITLTFETIGTRFMIADRGTNNVATSNGSGRYVINLRGFIGGDATGYEIITRTQTPTANITGALAIKTTNLNDYMAFIKNIDIIIDNNIAMQAIGQEISLINYQHATPDAAPYFGIFEGKTFVEELIASEINFTKAYINLKLRS